MMKKKFVTHWATNMWQYFWEIQATDTADWTIASWSIILLLQLGFYFGSFGKTTLFVDKTEGEYTWNISKNYFMSSYWDTFIQK